MATQVSLLLLDVVDSFFSPKSRFPTEAQVIPAEAQIKEESSSFVDLAIVKKEARGVSKPAGLYTHILTVFV